MPILDIRMFPYLPFFCELRILESVCFYLECILREFLNLPEKKMRLTVNFASSNDLFLIRTVVNAALSSSFVVLSVFSLRETNLSFSYYEGNVCFIQFYIPYICYTFVGKARRIYRYMKLCGTV